MVLLQSRVISSERIKECLWSAGFDPASVANLALEQGVRLTEYIKDKDVLLHVCIQLVDFQNLEDEIQSHMLTWLGDLAIERPAVIIPM